MKIDDVTFEELDDQWPFPARIHGEVIDRIAKDKPKVIAYDVQFTEPSPRRRARTRTSRFSRRSPNADGKVVLATTEVNERGREQVPRRARRRSCEEIGGKVGNGRLPTDPGGVFRRVDYTVDGLKTLVGGGRRGRRRDARSTRASSTARTAPGSTTTARPSTIESDLVLARGPGQDPSRASSATRSSWSGRTAPVAAGHPPHLDDRATTQMAGAEIQANALDTVLRDLPLQVASGRPRRRADRAAGAGRAAGEPAPRAAARAGARRSALGAVFTGRRPARLQQRHGAGVRLSRSARWCWPRSARWRSTT